MVNNWVTHSIAVYILCFSCYSTGDIFCMYVYFVVWLEMYVLTCVFLTRRNLWAFSLPASGCCTYWNIFLKVLPCASGNRLVNLGKFEENWPAVCWRIRAGGPHWKGKQLVNHLPENMQMAANGPGLIDRRLLFTQKNTPGLFKRAKSPQFPKTPNSSSVMFLLQVFAVQLCVLSLFFFICFHNLT